MKVRLDVSPEATIEVIEDDNGNPLAIELTPLFTGRNGTAVLTYGTATNDHDRVLDRFSLTVSGKTGRVSKQGRSEPVKAVVDMTEEELAAEIRAKTDGEDEEEAK